MDKVHPCRSLRATRPSHLSLPAHRLVGLAVAGAIVYLLWLPFYVLACARCAWHAYQTRLLVVASLLSWLVTRHVRDALANDEPISDRFFFRNLFFFARYKVSWGCDDRKSSMRTRTHTHTHTAGAFAGSQELV